MLAKKHNLLRVISSSSIKLAEKCEIIVKINLTKLNFCKMPDIVIEAGEKIWRIK